MKAGIQLQLEKYIQTNFLENHIDQMCLKP